MSARETHVTEWGLYLLATRPPTDPPEGLSFRSNDEMERAERAGFKAGVSGCGAESGGNDVAYHVIRTTIPTCPRCAVLRDEALEGKLPPRKSPAPE